jgi:tetratricopeptide (TPR) repeat protein
MGVVYAAYDPMLDRKVALKVLRPDATDSKASARLLREAQAMARLSHPNVITVHDVGVLGGRVFVAMEFVEGPTLTQWLKSSPRSWKEVLAMFSRAGRGLAAAHDAGLIHRDFKPENVLVGRDLRVRVVDFGLARPATQRPEDETPAPPDEAAFTETTTTGSSLLENPLTAAGSIIGTPAYMAPEQHTGGSLDARTDQFNFCVALYQGLYGKLPFSGSSLGELRSQVLKGRVREPPSDSPVPAWLRRAVLRGLSVEPQDRYPSMQALLSALARDPAASRRRWLAAAATAALLSGGILVYHQIQQGDAPQCRGAERHLQEVWGQERQRAIQAAFVGTGKPFAQAAWEGVQHALDGWAQRWAQMHVEACEATRVRGEQSEELLDLRMLCLSRRLREMDALTQLFARADAEVVTRAVQAAHTLTSLGECASVETLTARVKPPPDAVTSRKVEALRGDLAQARALMAAGKFREGLAGAAAAALAAQALGYRPLEAETLYRRGVLELETGDLGQAARTLAEAGWTAEAAGYDRWVARTWAKLVYVVGYRQGKKEDGGGWARHARAAIERLGGDDELEGMLQNGLGATALGQGEFQEALARFREAMRLRERLLGTEHPQVALVLGNVGLVLWRLGKLEEARAFLERDLALRQKLLGPEHPDVALPLQNLGGVLMEQKQYSAALGHLRRGLSIREAALGRSHPAVADTLNNLASALWSQGQHAEALSLNERALAIRRSALGPDHPSVAMSLVNLGASLYERREYERALAHYQQALKIQEKSLSGGDPVLASTLNNLAEALRSLGRYGEAMKHDERALAIAEKAFGPHHPDVAYALHGMAEAHLGLSAPARAIPLLERALSIQERSASDPAALAETRFALARALGGGQERARKLAQQAREAFGKAGPTYARQLAQVERWLRGGARR